jgi:hypothetical protein
LERPTTKGLEGQARVERRAAERLMPGRIADRLRPSVAIVVEAAAIAGAYLELGLGLDDGRAQHRRAHDQLYAGDLRLFRLPTGQNPFGIVRLDPTLEEAGRHRQAHGSLLDRFQVHARKPARIDVVADLGAQTPLHPCPAVLIRVRHFFASRSD